MSHANQSRRQFLKTSAAASAAAAAAGFTPYFTSAARAQEPSKNDRHAVGFIGTGDRLPGAVTGPARPLLNVLAVCDVDKKHLENGNKLAQQISSARIKARR